MSVNGWIKLHRAITQWEWIEDPNTLSVWINLLLRANFHVSRFRGIEVKPGQIIISRRKLADYCGISEKSVRTSLTRLKTANQVAIESANRFSLITIINWDTYQQLEGEQGPTEGPEVGPPKGQQRASKGPDPKKIKKERKKEEDLASVPEKRKRFGPDKSAWFLSTEAEYAAKVAKNGQPWVDYWIRAFNAWAQQRPPAASQSLPDHWLTVESWEQSRIEAGKEWCADFPTGPGYYESRKVQEFQLQLFRGENAQ